MFFSAPAEPFPLPFELKKTARARRLSVRIKAGGAIVVSAPTRISEKMITAFLWQHYDWLVKHVKLAQRRETSVKSDTEVAIFGKNYQLREGDGKVGVKIVENDVLVTPVSSTPASIKRQLELFLRTTAERYILPRTKLLADKMGITYHRLTMKQMTSRWGSCSSYGNLNFNWRLVHFAPAIIDYVIIHELAHRQQMNHSSKFWAIVERFDPLYRQHRQVLKKYGPLE
jgi:predicted metal-dependent hydrolase